MRHVQHQRRYPRLYPTLLALHLASFLVCPAPAQQPGAAPPAAASLAPSSDGELSAEWAKLLRDKLTDAYMASPRRDEARDDECRTLIDGFARFWAGVPDAPDAESLLKACEQKKGKINPAFMAAFRGLIYSTQGDGRARTTLPSARSSLTRYPHFFQAVFIITSIDVLTEAKATKQIPELITAGVAQLTAMSADTSLTLLEQRLIFEQMREFFDNDLAGDDADLARMTAAAEKDTWLGHMLAGAYHVKVGWQIRGGGFADTVTPEAWKGFEAHMVGARDHFERAYEIAPQNPAAATEMIRIVSNGYAREGQSERRWFDRAVKAQFDYAPAYSRYRWSLWPRWGGSHEEMLAFAMECAATRRYDTFVPFEAIEIIRDIGEDNEDFTSCWRLPGVLKMAEDVLKGTAEATPAEAHYHHSVLAAIAWRAAKYPKARETLNALAENFDMSAMKMVAGDAWDMYTDVFAYTGPAADAARRAADARDPRKAADILAAVVANPPKMTEGESVAIADKLYTATWQARLAETTDWVPLHFERDLRGWRQARGTWIVAKGDGVVGEPTDEGPSILLAGDLPARWEIKATIDPRVTETRTRQNAGVIIGHRQTWTIPRWHSVQFDPMRKHIACGAMWSTGGVIAGFKEPGPVTLRVAVWDREIVTFVNDVEICRAAFPHKTAETFDGAVGFGAFRRAQDPESLGPVEVRDVSIRRITTKP